MKNIKATLKVILSTDFHEDGESNEETLRYIVEQDLQDFGYDVEACEVIKE